MLVGNFLNCLMEGCSKSFSTFAAFMGHCAKGHGMKSMLSAVVKSNECLWCGSTMKDQQMCRKHLTASIINGRCDRDRSPGAFPLQPIPEHDWTCELCEFHWDSHHSMQRHFCQHFEIDARPSAVRVRRIPRFRPLLPVSSLFVGMASWMIQLPPKGEKVAKLAAAASQHPITAAAAVLDAEDDEVTLMASSIVELMRDARETRACVMDFVLIDKDVDLPHHLLLINKQYDKLIKLHKEQEAKKKKENASYEEQPRGQGSPFVQIYVGAVHKAIEVLMTPGVARQLDNEEMMLLALYTKRFLG